MTYDEAKRCCLLMVPDPGKRFWIQPAVSEESYLIEILALKQFITVTRPKRVEATLVLAMGYDSNHQWSMSVDQWIDLLNQRRIRELR